MQRVPGWLVADMQHVAQASVQTVLEAMEKRDLTHLPVMETGSDGKARVRGVFSRSKLLRLTEQSRKAGGKGWTAG